MEKNRKRFAKMFDDRVVLNGGSVYPIILYKKFEILKLIFFLKLKKITLLASCSSKVYLQKGRIKPKKKKNLKITITTLQKKTENQN
jgi:hypothetical protein